MRARILAISTTLTLLLFRLTACASPAGAPPATQPTTRPQPAAGREFLFTYEANVTGLQPGQVARIWVPIAPSNADQQAVIDHWSVTPDHSIGLEARYHNHVLYT